MRNTPTFNDYEKGPDFDRARTQIATPFQYLDIALDTATQNQQFNISGDFIYCDPAFDGVVTMELNNQQNAPVAPFYVQKNFALKAEFKSLKLSWSAQPGEKIRLMYSTGESVIPSNSGVLSVVGTINTIEDGFTYGSSFVSVAALAANTPQTIISPAANVNGAIVSLARFIYYELNYGNPVFISKASAPVSVNDGDVILTPTSPHSSLAGGYFNTSGHLEKTVKLAAGMGLYYICAQALTGGQRNCLYTLL